MIILATYVLTFARAETPNESHLTLSFAGQVAIRVDLETLEAAPFSYWFNFTWEKGLERDVAYAIMELDENGSLAGARRTFFAHGGLGEGDGAGFGFEANAYPEGSIRQAGTTIAGVDQGAQEFFYWNFTSGVSSYQSLMPPGKRTFIFMAGLSVPITRTTLDLVSGDTNAAFNWESTRNVELITARNLDQNGPHLWIRSLGAGASIALRSADTIHVDDGLMASAWYDHSRSRLGEFEVEGHGRRWDITDDPLLLIEPPGSYRLTLHEIDAGESFPGRAMFLYSDLAPTTAIA